MRKAATPKPLTAGPHEKPKVKSSDDLAWGRKTADYGDPVPLDRLFRR